MLLTATLAVRADLPEEDTGQSILLGPHVAEERMSRYEHDIRKYTSTTGTTNGWLINHSRGRITLKASEFHQQQGVILWSLLGAAINPTIQAGRRALLFLKKQP